MPEAQIVGRRGQRAGIDGHGAASTGELSDAAVHDSSSEKLGVGAASGSTNAPTSTPRRTAKPRLTPRSVHSLAAHRPTISCGIASEVGTSRNDGRAARVAALPPKVEGTSFVLVSRGHRPRPSLRHRARETGQIEKFLLIWRRRSFITRSPSTAAGISVGKVADASPTFPSAAQRRQCFAADVSGTTDSEGDYAIEQCGGGTRRDVWRDEPQGVVIVWEAGRHHDAAFRATRVRARRSRDPVRALERAAAELATADVGDPARFGR